ncbi:dienelactone hydrolase family protein [Maribacter sp. 1_MG-2023]|uniref:alpha/beta hydrolase family protein n=1 Tax=Maribacter sp. 1_MG-2023 TaxID=3062677 RepID=UPI0026E29064|nr:dienelactone hydrolase family protein [Maribacter sp. 1_MG-2023]MDO6470667.1 dienelactone hydrolase family protein [Maribacter sp. 1_MG-2023]
MCNKVIQNVVIIIFCSILFSCKNDHYLQPTFKTYLKTHTYAIGQSKLVITDVTRNRPLNTEFWYPTNDTTKVNVTVNYRFKLPPTSKDATFIAKKYPLILISHGTGGNRINHSWLASELASNGFIVAAVDHYGNTFDNKIPENFVKAWDRPLDISFILDHILKHSKFKNIIEPSKIGVAGFSLGGYTTIALAGGEIDYIALSDFSKTDDGKKEFNTPEFGDVSKYMTPKIIDEGNTTYKQLKDNRITAFVAMAPAIGQGFVHKNQLAKINDSILIVSAENDSRAPVKTNAVHYHKMIKKSRQIMLTGEIDHYVFMNEAKLELEKEAPTLFKDDASINRRKIHNKVSKSVLTFFKNQFD